jgi:hypothetical protein
MTAFRNSGSVPRRGSRVISLFFESLNDSEFLMYRASGRRTVLDFAWKRFRADTPLKILPDPTGPAGWIV